MNAPFVAVEPSSHPLLTTRAGEGFDRKAWTVAELKTLVEAGAMSEAEPFELIEGELLARSPKFNRHELWKRRLNRWLASSLPPHLAVAVEATLFLSETSAPEPDLMVHADDLLPEQVRGSHVLLLVEVSDSSSRRDLILKAGLYARHGVQNYWVLDAERRRAILHSRPAAEGYAEVVSHEATVVLTLPFPPHLSLRLEDLGQA